MAHLSSNPVADAQDHIHAEDRIAQVCDYKCKSCKEGFGPGYGVKITDEKFCNECIAADKHSNFYEKVCGLDKRQIEELKFYLTEL